MAGRGLAFRRSMKQKKARLQTLAYKTRLFIAVTYTLGRKVDILQLEDNPNIKGGCMTPRCVRCNNEFSQGRFDLGYVTCLQCGKVEASKVVRCVVPLHKSNYILVTNKEELKGINNKGGKYE